MTRTLEIHFTSDWRIGAGAGVPGSIDARILRDRDELPYVPAKSVKGMLRDGCETVANVLGGDWPSVVTTLFGLDKEGWSGGEDRSTPSRVIVRRGRLPSALRVALLPDDRRSLRDALTFVKPQVAIDPDSGRAVDGALAFVEVVRCDSTVHAELTWPDDISDIEKALLYAGTKAVRRMGGRRRRGLGRCAMTILDFPPAPGGSADWLAWLEANVSARVSLPQNVETAERPAIAGLSASPSAGAWIIVPYTLTAKSPLCLQDRVVGNVTETLDYVPGTHLLRLIHCALTSLGADAASLIRSGRALITNALPAQLTGRPSWPVPHALAAAKAGRGMESATEPVFNLLDTRTSSARLLKSSRSGYVSAAASPAGWTYRNLKSSLETHNAVADEPQRPTEAGGGPYTFEVLPEGELLSGEVRLDKAALSLSTNAVAIEQALLQAAKGYTIGRAQRDEFGDIALTFHSAREWKPAASDAVEPKSITVWLLSDVLVRDRFHAWSSDPRDFAHALAHALKAEPTCAVTLTLDPADDCNAFGRGHRTEGWVGAWDAPRATVVGLAAGSCFRFRVTGRLSNAAIAAAQIRGVGERRAEGFGQLAIEPELLRATVVQATAAPSGHVDGVLDPLATPAALTGDLFARRLETEAWRTAIRQAAQRAKSHENLAIDLAPGPPASQIGALRSVFLRLSDSADSRAAALRWVIHLRSRPNRAEKWSDTTLNALVKLLEWTLPSGSTWEQVDQRLGERTSDTRALLDVRPGFTWEQARVWRMLFSTPAVWPASFEGATSVARLTKELWPFAVSTLVTTLCHETLDEHESRLLEGV